MSETRNEGKKKRCDCFLEIFKHYELGGHRGRDRMVVGFTTIFAISAYHH